MCSDAPDMTGINAAAEQNAEIARETLAFYRQAYADQAPLRQQASQRADQVAGAQLSLMEQQRAISDERMAYERGTFRPLEQRIVADANSFDTPERREAAAAAAASGLQRQFADAEAAEQRQQASMGVRPDSGRASAIAAQRGVMRAAAIASSKNDARDRVETQGYARRMDAASLGRGIASAQATNAQIASQTGSAAIGSAQAPLAVAQQGVAMMGQGLSSAASIGASAGQLYGDVARMQQQAQSSEAQAWGQLVGTGATAAAMYFSDKGVKSDVQAMGDDEALEAVRKTPVSKWRYDPAKGGPDDGGQQHVGPMAQDVQRTMGDDVAPGGKVIDAVSMNGVAMKGIQALDKKVEKLAGVVARMAQQRGAAGVAA